MGPLQHLIESYDTEADELQTLQHLRISDILLVASLYDSYTLSEGKHLSELLYGAYHNLSLMTPPRILRVSTRAKALKILGERPFELVITMASAEDMPLPRFGRSVKRLQPETTVYVMAYNAREIQDLEHGPDSPHGVDRAFIWRGDVRLLLSLIKLVEDRRNAAYDSKTGGVRTLILVEDSLPFYSSYLPMLLDEFVKQTEALITKSINIGERLLRRRLRPKIMLATTFEEGWALYEEYEGTVLAVISDVRFPRDGELDRRSGIDLLGRIRERDKDLPLLLQSSKEEYALEAEKLNAAFVHKRSPTLLQDFRRFMLQHLGFGDFIFRDPSGDAIARADDIDSMLQALALAPDDSLRYHATRNHFSNWLMARTEFRLASELRQLRIADFNSIASMRDFLRDRLEHIRMEHRRGEVEDFRVGHFDATTEFVRIGDGSLGGKGRGLAFVHGLIARSEVAEALDGLRVFVPHSAVVGTGVFDDFLESNDLLEFALHEADDHAILQRFLHAPLPGNVHEDLRAFLERVRYPLAVRSSSLLEDSHHLPAAGIYPTHMIPNIDEDPRVRLDELERAIKHIYASTFFRDAKAYLESTPSRAEDEKMAVVIQQIVGRRHGDVVYPDLSGTARSFNFYPVRAMKPEEGIATIALGLGKQVVEGGRAVRFSPAHPQWLPQLSTPEDILENAQRDFWALDVTASLDLSEPDTSNNLVQLRLEEAERHGSLWAVASVYSPDNHAVYEGLSRQGIRIVTMAPILKHKLFPLPEAIQTLLELGRLGMSGPVEMEFAANADKGPDGRRDFAVLQIRPLVTSEITTPVSLEDIEEDNVFIRSPKALGVGRNDEIRDIIAVRTDTFDRARTVEIAEEIGRLNARLQEEGRPYLLFGPGRWGTSDRWLGIPVSWYQIAGARTIVECAVQEVVVEPSQGTHFFQNMTSLGIGYFSPDERNGAKIDWDWLRGLKPAEELQWVRHYALDEPLEVLIDGRKGEGIVLKRARPRG